MSSFGGGDDKLNQDDEYAYENEFEDFEPNSDPEGEVKIHSPPPTQLSTVLITEKESQAMTAQETIFAYDQLAKNDVFLEESVRPKSSKIMKDNSSTFNYSSNSTKASPWEPPASHLQKAEIFNKTVFFPIELSYSDYIHRILGCVLAAIKSDVIRISVLNHLPAINSDDEDDIFVLLKQILGGGGASASSASANDTPDSKSGSGGGNHIIEVNTVIFFRALDAIHQQKADKINLSERSESSNQAPAAFTLDELTNVCRHLYSMKKSFYSFSVADTTRPSSIGDVINSAQTLLTMFGKSTSCAHLEQLRVLSQQFKSHSEFKEVRMEKFGWNVTNTLTETDSLKEEIDAIFMKLNSLLDPVSTSYTRMINRLVGYISVIDQLIEQYPSIIAAPVANAESGGATPKKDLREKEREKEKEKVVANEVRRLRSLKHNMQKAMDADKSDPSWNTAAQLENIRSTCSEASAFAIRISELDPFSDSTQSIVFKINKAKDSINSLLRPFVLSIDKVPVAIKDFDEEFILLNSSVESDSLLRLIRQGRRELVLRCVCECWYKNPGSGSRTLIKDVSAIGDGDLFSVEAFRQAGFNLGELKSAGFELHDLIQFEYGLSKFRALNYPLKQLMSYFTLADLKSVGYPLFDLLLVGFSVADLKEVGFVLSDLKAAGCTLGQLKSAGFSVADLKAVGFVAVDFWSNGFSASQLKNAKFNLNEIKSASYTASELRRAGFTIEELKKAGFVPSELKAAGFSLQDFTQINCFSAKELKSAGFPLEVLRTVGFSPAALREANFSAYQLHFVRVPLKDLLVGGYSVADLHAAGFSLEEINAESTSLANSTLSLYRRRNRMEQNNLKYTKKMELLGKTPGGKGGKPPAAAAAVATEAPRATHGGKESSKGGGSGKQQTASATSTSTKTKAKAGAKASDAAKAATSSTAVPAVASSPKVSDMSALELKQVYSNAASKMSPSELQKAGFSPRDLKSFGFSAKKLREGGYGIIDIDLAKYSLKDLKEAGYTAADLKSIRYSHTQLFAAGFSLSELKQARFSASQLRSLGASVTELNTVGYGWNELDEAGYYNLLGFH